MLHQADIRQIKGGCIVFYPKPFINKCISNLLYYHHLNSCMLFKSHDYFFTEILISDKMMFYIYIYSMAFVSLFVCFFRWVLCAALAVLELAYINGRP